MTTPTTKEALAELKPGLYAILYRDNWDGEGDTYHLLAEFNDVGQWSSHESGRELLEYEGDEILSVWVLGEDTDVLEQLSAKDKRIAEQSMLLEGSDAILADYAEALGCAGDTDSILAAIVALQSRAESAEQALPLERDRIPSVNLPKLTVNQVMSLSGFGRDYAEGWCAGNDNARHAILRDGIALLVQRGE